jgi:hypothetical protein
VAPYQYNNGGAFQSSNTFAGLFKIHYYSRDSYTAVRFTLPAQTIAPQLTVATTLIKI